MAGPDSGENSTVTTVDETMQALADLAGVALSQTDLESTLVEVCRIAVRGVGPAEGASVTTFPQGRPGAVGSDPWAQQLDELQYAEHEGPCLDAYRTGNAFRVRDLEADARWPSYVPRAVAIGARSMMSLPMAAEGNTVGALNLYSRTVDAFDAEDASIAEIVAAHAALACQVSAALFGHRDLAEQLAEAMRSRAVIEQAKGVLIAQNACTADQAFDLLVKMSQRANRKLRQISEDLVADAIRGGASGG